MARSTYVELPTGEIVRIKDIDPNEPMEWIDPNTGEKTTLPAEQALAWMATQQQTRGPHETIGGRRGQPAGLYSALGQIGATGGAGNLGEYAFRTRNVPVQAMHQAQFTGAAPGLEQAERARQQREMMGTGEYADLGRKGGLPPQARGVGLAVGRDRRDVMMGQPGKRAGQALGASARPNPAFAEFQENVQAPNVAMGSVMAAAAAGDPVAQQTIDDLRNFGYDAGDIGGVAADTGAIGGVEGDVIGGQATGYDPSETGALDGGGAGGGDAK